MACARAPQSVEGEDVRAGWEMRLTRACKSLLRIEFADFLQIGWGSYADCRAGGQIAGSSRSPARRRYCTRTPISSPPGAAAMVMSCAYGVSI
jgi:hypothetical protein